MYDYLIVGAGLYGAVFAREMLNKNKKVLVVDKRNHIAGNIYTNKINDICVHQYGAHIFHTNNKQIWDYVNQFAEFNRYTNSPVANFNNEIYSLPFNMYTFNKMWGVIKPEGAMAIIKKQRDDYNISNPKNLTEQAISLVGIDIFEKLIKGYTEKQWGMSCDELSADIIKRLPVRYTYDNNYFNALYQGIPIKGYTNMIQNMLHGADVRLNTDYLKQRSELNALAKTIVFTGPIDAFYDYKYGALEYRSLKFEYETLNINNYQGNAVVNFTDNKIPYTRIIEHKWFTFGKDEMGRDINGTVITKEYPILYNKGLNAYYPINNIQNNDLYQKYKELAKTEKNIIFGGRLGEYKYYDMDQVILSALERTQSL